jgi:hypothetical protein
MHCYLQESISGRLSAVINAERLRRLASYSEVGNLPRYGDPVGRQDGPGLAVGYRFSTPATLRDHGVCESSRGAWRVQNWRTVCRLPWMLVGKSGKSLPLAPKRAYYRRKDQPSLIVPSTAQGRTTPDHQAVTAPPLLPPHFAQARVSIGEGDANVPVQPFRAIPHTVCDTRAGWLGAIGVGCGYHAGTCGGRDWDGS